MKAARALLEMLKGYEIGHVFGLPGETTIPLYYEWIYFEDDIKHIMLRDERNACFAADGYSKVSYKPGICEAPSAGVAHVIPSVIEAYKSSTPMIFITTDVPLYLEKRNALTSFDQTKLFSGIVKESLTVYRGEDIPLAMRRAFRLATTGRPGPVHIRIPVNVLEEECSNSNLYVQKEFSKYPGQRFVPPDEHLVKAVDFLLSSERPLIVCGQGALYSQAWDEIVELAEILKIPVGSTISGKGCFPEAHPLSIGVIGSRGGTSFSNEILRNADLIFYIGSNVDQVTTDDWTLPKPETKVIHLDISEVEVGNHVRTDLELIGDAKATLKKIINILKARVAKDDTPWVKYVIERKKDYESMLANISIDVIGYVNPYTFIKTFMRVIPKNYIITCDAGTGAIYTSAYFKVQEPGRKVLFNYSIGALGYAVPAAIGAYYANPNNIVFALTGDGSFGFIAGELETLSRLQPNIKVIIFNNLSFGWIRASILMHYGPRYFATDFKPIDYVKIAKGFGLEGIRASKEDLESNLREIIRITGPAILDVPVPPEDQLIPPVPSWANKARLKGYTYIY